MDHDWFTEIYIKNIVGYNKVLFWTGSIHPGFETFEVLGFFVKDWWRNFFVSSLVDYFKGL